MKFEQEQRCLVIFGASKMSDKFATPRNDVPRRPAKLSTRQTTTTPSATGNLNNPSRRLSAAFKSPLRQFQENSSQVSPGDEVRLRQEIATLQEKEVQLDKEVESLIALGYQEEELKQHIQKLHDYNEIKDIGQMLLGKIAVHQGLTTKDLYAQYSLSLED